MSEQKFDSFKTMAWVWLLFCACANGPATMALALVGFVIAASLAFAVKGD